MIRFGIVGAGSIARKFASDIEVAHDAILTAVASRSIEKATSFQQEFNIPHGFGSYEEMAASDEIDVAYIATPHNFHMEQAILFMKHKKHVLCEKPIAVNKDQLEQMIAVAKENDVFLMEALWTRFLPAMQTLDDVLKTNTLGPLVEADLRFGFALTDHVSADGRILNKHLAGGSLLDIGVYPISVLRFVTTDAIKSMSTSALMSSTDVDLYVVVDAVLDNKQQTKVHIESAVDRYLSNKAIFRFQNGTIEIPQFWSTTSLQINGVLQQHPHRRGGFEYQIEHVVRAIMANKKESEQMPHSFSLRTLSFLDAIRKQIHLRYPFE